MEYRQSESLNKPIAFDDKSSKSGVYARFCVEEKDRKDNDDSCSWKHVIAPCVKLHLLCILLTQRLCQPQA